MHGRSSSNPGRRIHPDSVVCDSSALISITDTGLIGALAYIRPWLRGELLISPAVEDEAITHPMRVPQYSFSAIRLERALRDGVIRVVAPKPETITAILDAANNIFSARGKSLALVHPGEAEILALAVDYGIKTILMDERTTRMFVEAPLLMRGHLSNELHVAIDVNRDALSRFQGMSEGIHVIRSSEIIALAYETRYFKKYRELEKEAFQAALYAAKFSGCAIGFDEVRDLVRTEG